MGSLTRHDLKIDCPSGAFRQDEYDALLRALIRNYDRITVYEWVPYRPYADITKAKLQRLIGTEPYQHYGFELLYGFWIQTFDTDLYIYFRMAFYRRVELHSGM